MKVWIVCRKGEPMAVHSTEADAREDVDRRTERGARPDLDHIYHVEGWLVSPATAEEEPKEPPNLTGLVFDESSGRWRRVDAACRVCGCTEDRACAGGCMWVPDPELLGDLCSACLPGVVEARA